MINPKANFQRIRRGIISALADPSASLHKHVLWHYVLIVFVVDFFFILPSLLILDQFFPGHRPADPELTPLFMASLVIFAPILEEALYRLPILEKKRYILIGFIVGFFIIISGDNLPIQLSTIFALVTIVLFRLKWINMRFLIIINSLFFALGHSEMADFESVNSLIVFPFTIFSQFIFSILAYILIRRGFWVTVLFHALGNLTLLIAMLLFD